jgi:hypothetical protein
MSEILTVEDIRRRSGWREALEERQNYEHERRKREQAQVKAREVEQKPQAVTSNWGAWVGVIDQRIEQHFFSGDLGVGGALRRDWWGAGEESSAAA